MQQYTSQTQSNIQNRKSHESYTKNHVNNDFAETLTSRTWKGVT